jgi:uncharacterized protein
MRIGIISDSHDSHANVVKAVRVFNDEKVEYVFHAGDIASPKAAKTFAELQTAKFIAVYGNCDAKEEALLQNAIDAFGGEIQQPPYSGQFGNRRIYMTHKPDLIESIAATGEYDLVIYGHTHDTVIRRVGKTLVINPGVSMHKALSQSYVVILELDDMTCRLVPLR